MACQIFTPLTLSTEALYHFVHSDSLCTLKGFQLKKDIIYISVHNSNKHTPSPSGILKARYLRFLNIFNFSITNLNIHFRFYKKDTSLEYVHYHLKKKIYSFKELKKTASIRETSFSLLHIQEHPSTKGHSSDRGAEQHQGACLQCRHRGISVVLEKSGTARQQDEVLPPASEYLKRKRNSYH